MKLDLILESIRDEYMIQVLEEGEVTELESLKTKRFLNESIKAVRGMLVEEGIMGSVKNHLANNWKKYAAGAATAAAVGNPYSQDAINTAAHSAAADPAGYGQSVVDGGQALAGDAAQAIQGAAGQAATAAQPYVDQAGQMAGQAADRVSDLAGQAKAAATNFYDRQVNGTAGDMTAKESAAFDNPIERANALQAQRAYDASFPSR